jgi:hypothetical protein
VAVRLGEGWGVKRVTRHPVEVEVGTQGDAEAARFRGVKVA